MSEVVKGEGVTEEEAEGVKTPEKRKNDKARDRRRREKWLFLSAKESLTPEEQEWLAKEKGRRTKSPQARRDRKDKLQHLMSKETLTGEEKVWLEKENQRLDKKRSKERESDKRRRQATQEKWLLLSSKDALAPEEQEWLKKERKNRKRSTERSAAHRLANREAMSEYFAEYRRVNKKHIKEASARHYKQNKEQVLQKCKERRDSRTREQKDEFNKMIREWKSERLKQDPAFAILCRARGRITAMLCGAKKGRPTRGQDRFEAYFGCDRKTAVSYIESQFRGEMSWANHGKVWQLDHIVPLSAGLRNHDLLMKLNHYRNLQPLTIEENHRKRDSMPEIWPDGVPFTREEVLESISKNREGVPECSRKIRQKRVSSPILNNLSEKTCQSV